MKELDAICCVMHVYYCYVCVCVCVCIASWLDRYRYSTLLYIFVHKDMWKAKSTGHVSIAIYMHY
jgi:hypothetical protein